MTTKTDNHAEEQAEAQYSSIVRMLAAVACDYDRLQELRDEREELAEAVKDAEASRIGTAGALQQYKNWGTNPVERTSRTSNGIYLLPVPVTRTTPEEIEELEHTLKAAEEAETKAHEALSQWKADNAEELAELEDAAGECTDEDEARQIIQEDALEVQVRSDWENPGAPLEAVEFMILLCTGGPAVRIVGELNRGEPCRAWLEYQDWGTPWAQWFGAKSDTLCEYAANFFFGE
jgi:hypothetical protein